MAKNMNLTKKQDLVVDAKMVNPEIMGQDNYEFTVEIPLPEQFGGKTARISVKADSRVVSSVVAQEKLTELAKKNVETFVGGLGSLSEELMNQAGKWYDVLKAWKEKEREEGISYDWQYHLNEFISAVGERAGSITKGEIKSILEDERNQSNYNLTDAIKWGLVQLKKYELGYLNKAQVEELGKYITLK